MQYLYLYLHFLYGSIINETRAESFDLSQETKGARKILIYHHASRLQVIFCPCLTLKILNVALLRLRS
jgi:hypothetical protein